MVLDALLKLVIYITPFLIIGIAVKRWMAQRGVTLSEVRAEGSLRQKRSKTLRRFPNFWMPPGMSRLRFPAFRNLQPRQSSSSPLAFAKSENRRSITGGVNRVGF